MSYTIMTPDEYLEAKHMVEAFKAGLTNEERRLVEVWELQVAIDSIEFYNIPPEMPEDWCSSYQEEKQIQYTESQQDAWVAGYLYGAKDQVEFICEDLEGGDLILRFDEAELTKCPNRTPEARQSE